MLPEQTVAKILTQQKKTLSTAESCSGGLLADKLTDIPGSSIFFKVGVVAYSDEAKKKILKIPALLLSKYGAVSLPVARIMAQAIRKISKTDFGISITGIAGPTRAMPQKPIGLTFIAVSTAQQTAVKKFIFKGNRLEIKNQSTTQALRLLLKFLGFQQ